MHVQLTSHDTPGAAVPRPPDLHTEEILRANAYLLLARSLVRPPDQDFLHTAAQLQGDATSEFGVAVGELAQRAAEADVDTAAREYHELFIGLGRGELLPYASYYLTGFLHEKPLAKLRHALNALGIARAPDVHEPEDHIGSLCEVMHGLITGAFGPPAAVAQQKEFFAAHIEPWAKHFFADLEKAKGADLYSPIGRMGRLFMEIESTAFEMEA